MHKRNHPAACMQPCNALEAKYLTSGSSSEDIADNAGTTDASSVCHERVCRGVQK